MSENSPAPVPARGVYGFALYLVCSSAFILYLIWAFLPDEWLHFVGITYYPQKYWAIAIPVYLLMGLALFAFFIYPSLNQLLTPPLDSNNTYTDKMASIKTEQTFASYDEGGIPPAYDLEISYVSSKLYRN